MQDIFLLCFQVAAWEGITFLDILHCKGNNAFSFLSNLALDWLFKSFPLNVFTIVRGK